MSRLGARPVYEPSITLGNVLTILSMIGFIFAALYGSPGDSIRAEARSTVNEARITALEAANVLRDKRDLEFQRDVRQELRDIHNEISAGDHVRWRELPPSPYRGRDR